MSENEEDKVNIFIAYMLSGESQTKMQKVENEVKELFLPDGKDEKFFHCTLLFIGKVDRSYIPFIQEQMEEIAASQCPIPMTIDNIGYFYNHKKERIKVMYAVTSTIPETLNMLCSRFYDKIGRPLEGKTTPPIQRARIHFTITKRLKRKLSPEKFKQIRKELNPFRIDATIDNFGLYYCKDAEHRYYREIRRYEFQKGNDK